MSDVKRLKEERLALIVRLMGDDINDLPHAESVAVYKAAHEHPDVRELEAQIRAAREVEGYGHGDQA